MELKTVNRNTEINDIIIYHQNTQSLNNKREELGINMKMDHVRPRLICLSEHHKRKPKIIDLLLNGYTLVSSFCREESSGGGVCILTSTDIRFKTSDLKKICYEKRLEICAIKLNIKMIKLIVCCIYRAPSGNLKQFFDLLGSDSKLSSSA